MAAEKRVASHHLGERNAQHGRGQRIGDLILHHLGSLAQVFGVDDHLYIREVRDGVERRFSHRQGAAQYYEYGDQNNHELVVD